MGLPEPEGLSPSQLRSHRLALRLLLPLLVLLLAIVTPLYVLYDVAKVDGPSMLPTLRDSEYLLITRGWNHPRRGDVVVVHWAHGGTAEEIVKRIVALPGDVVGIKGDRATVNGEPEAFAHEVIARSGGNPIELTIPADTVFLMGDNRADSTDSRMIGPLPLSAIHGRVVAVWAPIGRIRVVPSP